MTVAHEVDPARFCLRARFVEERLEQALDLELAAVDEPLAPPSSEAKSTRLSMVRESLPTESAIDSSARLCASLTGPIFSERSMLR